MNQPFRHYIPHRDSKYQISNSGRINSHVDPVLTVSDALRYQNSRDWKSYKDIISNYSGNSEIFDNIDLLLFYQFKNSKFANDPVYNKLKNYEEIQHVFNVNYGDELEIKNGSSRYMKKEDLSALIESGKPDWYDEDNFLENIQLFSNNQILYKFVRCEAVHQADSPLFNPSYSSDTERTTYADNHQVDRQLIFNSLRNIVENLKNECEGSASWPWEL